MTMPFRPARRLAAPCWLVLAVALAAQSPRDRHIVGPEAFTMRVVAAGLDNPWDLAWGPDGSSGSPSGPGSASRGSTRPTVRSRSR